MDKILAEAIERTEKEAIPGKVDWSGSPFLRVKDLGKNAVGGFGENLYATIQESLGNSAQVVRAEHDVLVSTSGGFKKVEVKTAFQSKSKSFFFNQIRLNHDKTEAPKDWDTLAFIFVEPHKIEVWEIDRANLNAREEFKWNNGWSWNRRSSQLLSSTWRKIYDGAA